MTTTINPEVEASLLSISEEVRSALLTAVGQSIDHGTRLTIGASVNPKGRYTKRAPRGKGKPKVVAPAVSASAVAVIGATSGEEVYARPNGSLYYARTWGEHQDIGALREARKATSQALFANSGSPLFTLLYGSPGTGKTALVEACFPDVYTVMGTGDTEVSDLVGGYVQTPAGGFEWVDGPLLRASEEGAVLFIDEIGLIDPKVLSVVYGAMDGRKEIVVTANPERGSVPINEGFYVVGATNPNAPGVRLSEALLSRFTLQVEMTTDWNLAKTLGVPQPIVTCGQNLAKKQASGEVSWSPQMRELLAFRDVATKFGDKFAIENLLAVAPEIDRPVVADVISRVFGAEYKPARI